MTSSQQIESMDSPVFIQIFGTTNTTPKHFLEPNEEKFMKNSIERFQISSNNVGEVRWFSLEIRWIDSNSGFQIERILIGNERLGTVKDWHLARLEIRQAEQRYRSGEENFINENDRH